MIIILTRFCTIQSYDYLMKKILVQMGKPKGLRARVSVLNADHKGIITNLAYR